MSTKGCRFVSHFDLCRVAVVLMITGYFMSLTRIKVDKMVFLVLYDQLFDGTEMPHFFVG